jgi:hypothetical protein
MPYPADHVKFNLPGAWTLHVLAWGMLDFMTGYEASGQLQYALRTLKFGADFLMACHVDDDTIVAQVGQRVMRWLLLRWLCGCVGAWVCGCVGDRMVVAPERGALGHAHVVWVGLEQVVSNQSSSPG